jgi:glycosyltransferase involved in cell wall biosynthesis
MLHTLDEESADFSVGVAGASDNRIKVVIASCGLGHVTRGIESWAADLSRALHQRGQNVILCKGGGEATKPYERVIQCWPRDGEKTAKLLRWRIPGAWRLGFGSPYEIEQTTFGLNLVWYLRKHPADILHVQDPKVAMIVQQARNLGLIETRAVLSHGTEESISFLTKVDYLQQSAPHHMEEVKAAGAWKREWEMIPNFVDCNAFAPGDSSALRAEMRIPPEGLVVLTAAAIKRGHKRIDYLISEFEALLRENPQPPAWLVVSGGREAETDELVADGIRRLGERVRFLVQWPRQDMPELFRLADVFVLCSLKEMMPLALLEALASGLPCLVHQYPVMQWMTGAGGQAIDMSAPGALAGAIKALLADAPRRQAMGQAARAHCRENFSRERVVDRLLDSYRRIMGLSTPPEPRPATA